MITQDSKLSLFLTFVGLLLLQLVLLGVASFVVMLLWNIVVPAVFSGPVVAFGTAFALVTLIWVVGNLVRSK